MTLAYCHSFQEFFVKFLPTVSWFSLIAAAAIVAATPVSAFAQTTRAPAATGSGTQSAVAADKDKVAADKAAIAKDKANFNSDKAQLREDEKKERKDAMKERNNKK